MGRYNALRAITGKRNRKFFAPIGGAFRNNLIAEMSKPSGSGLYRYKRSRTMKHRSLRGRGLYTGGVSSYAGQGLYTGRASGAANQLIAGGRRAQNYRANNDETGAVTISNKEYVRDIFAPNTGKFTVQFLPLNPGLEQTFPWLSQTASNYDEYEFLQLVFFYRTAVDSGAIENGQTGTILGVVNYNPTAPLFDSKEVALQYHGSVSAQITQDLTIGVECAKTKIMGDGHKLTRSAAVLDDLKDYDAGNLQLCFSNTFDKFADLAVGELWVEYKVKLSKPKLSSAKGDSISHYIGGTSYAASSSTMSWAATTVYYPFGPVGMSDWVIGAKNGLEFDHKLGADPRELYLTLPGWLSGVYRVSLRVEGTSLNQLPSAPSLGMLGEVYYWLDRPLGNLATPGVDGFDHGMYCKSASSMVMSSDFKVNPSMGGVNNQIVINFPDSLGNPNITSLTVEVTEMNSTGSRNRSVLYNNTTSTVPASGAIDNRVLFKTLTNGQLIAF